MRAEALGPLTPAQQEAVGVMRDRLEKLIREVGRGTRVMLFLPIVVPTGPSGEDRSLSLLNLP